MGYKYLDSGEKILSSQKTNVPNGINQKTLEAQITQKPNSRLLGLPIAHLVHVYHIGLKRLDTSKIEKKIDRLALRYNRRTERTKNPSKASRITAKKNRKIDRAKSKIINGNQFMKWGETLSVFDSSQNQRSLERIEQYLFTKGFFNVEVSSKLQTSGKLISRNFIIKAKEPYVIDSVITKVDNPRLDSLVDTAHPRERLLDKTYDQQLITAERDRIYDLTSQNGYFNFSKQSISFEIDTSSLGGQKLITKLVIPGPEVNEVTQKKYRLDSVIFNTEGGRNITKSKISAVYKGIRYNQTSNNYAEKILDRRIFIRPGDLYNRALTVETQKQLSYLDIFKFVNINYDTTGGQFQANIFTSPLKKFQTSTEAGLSIFDNAQGLPGPFVNFNTKNRNLFHRMEIVDFQAGARIQGISSVNDQDNIYSRLQLGGEVGLTIPTFLFPLGNGLNSRIRTYNPRTKFSIGVNYEDRFSEYERNTFNASIGYILQTSNQSQVTFDPLNVSYINSNNEPAFRVFLDSLIENGNRSYASAFESSFVGSTSFLYDLRINDYGLSQNTSSFLRSFVEYGGIIQDVLGDSPFDNANIDLTYYRYLKANFDFRHLNRINRKSSWAFRINLGFAYAYGETNALPYEKYFFAGGSNSIRAWNPRRLGPGAYAIFTENEDGSKTLDDQREQPGDIILESTLEWRTDLVGFVEFAAFLDAGNVWLWNSSTVDSSIDPEGDDGVFKWRSFYEEMALGAGLGFRLDFSFLVLRLDGAYKVIDPAQALGDRWVFDKVKLNNLLDRDILTFNIGIGYPF